MMPVLMMSTIMARVPIRCPISMSSTSSTTGTAMKRRRRRPTAQRITEPHAPRSPAVEADAAASSPGRDGSGHSTLELVPWVPDALTVREHYAKQLALGVNPGVCPVRARVRVDAIAVDRPAETI